MCPYSTSGFGFVNRHNLCGLINIISVKNQVIGDIMKIIHDGLNPVIIPKIEKLKKLKSLNSFYDCVYVINLDHRQDRLKSINDQFTKIGLKYVRFPGIKTEKGAEGCRLSHLAILKDAKEKNYKRILICEDDLLLREKIVEDMPAIVDGAEGCDLLFFHSRNEPIEDEKVLVTRRRAPWCTQMYAVFNIDNVLKVVLANNVGDRGIDAIYVNNRRLNVAVTLREYAFQSNSYSDIDKRVVGRFNHQIPKYDDLLNIEKPK